MHSQLTELPLHNPASTYLSTVWGGLQVGYTTVPMAVDCTPLYADMPGGVCNCPHWGYIFEGALTAHYPNGEHEDDTARTGDVYYFPPGHVLIYLEATKALEFNPPEELETLMEAIYTKMKELGFAASD
jgi:hypothetical protein